MDDDVEEVLHGGFSTHVVRRGATVRRTASPWTPTVPSTRRIPSRARAGPSEPWQGVDLSSP